MNKKNENNYYTFRICNLNSFGNIYIHYALVLHNDNNSLSYKIKGIH